VRVAILGCSAGPEAYSIAWAIRNQNRDLRLVLHALDISREAVEFAKRGIYSLKTRMGDQHVHDFGAAGRWRVSDPGSVLVGSEVFERMTEAERADFFDVNGGEASVKSWIREGIEWHVSDARSPELSQETGPVDVVVASNFLCHMADAEAEQCLQNIGRLASNGGYLFVSGVNLNVKAKVAKQLGWDPVMDLIEEVHDGDPCLRGLWPGHYAGLEPLSRRAPDWKIRYAAAFCLPPGEPRQTVLEGVGQVTRQGAAALETS